MEQQAREGQFGWGVLLCQLLAGQTVGLWKHRLTLIVKILRKHAQLRTIGIKINSHPHILPNGLRRVTKIDDLDGLDRSVTKQ